MLRPLLISGLLTSTALAETWTVDDDGKADFDNIQAAVDAASDGDEIIVMPGTYTSVADEVVDMRNKGITLRSSDPNDPSIVATTIIDGEDVRRGIVCSGEIGEPQPNLSIHGFTITNGYWHTTGGGGMFISGSSPTLMHCSFINNTSSTKGGAIYSYYSLGNTFQSCTFESNDAWDGGAIYNRQSYTFIASCTFNNNTAVNGGGIYNEDSAPTFTNCSFSNNVVKNNGGAVYNKEGGNSTMTSCTFTANIAGQVGGAINNWKNSPTITNCTFTGNNAGYGGGIYNYYLSNPSLSNCNFTDNNATANGSMGGGMLNNSNCNPTLNKCIFTGNTSRNWGGGIANEGNCNPILQGCNFINNSATYQSGGGIYNRSQSNAIVENCTFNLNYAQEFGGGMFNDDSDPIIKNCIFENNSTYYSDDAGINSHGGGGIANEKSSCIIEDSTFINNASNAGGGMLNGSNCESTLQNCIFIGNFSNNIGGGIFNRSNSFVLANCSIKNNTAKGWAGGGIMNYGSTSLADTTICGNTPDQIEGSLIDNGGNTIQEDCPVYDNDSDGIPDKIDNCYLYNPDQADCNDNGLGDVCDVSDGTSYDCDQNSVPDECQPDCDGDGLIDACENDADLDGDGIPDNCEFDCNKNAIPDDFEIELGLEQDCNNNNTPDSCEMENGGFIVGATATITFTDPTGSEDVGKTIEIISHDGTSITYIGQVSSGAIDREFNTTISKENSALTLKLCLDHANGHAGKIITVDNGDGTLTLTQVVPGELGNTDITENLSSCTATNFNGGVNITGLDCNANGVPDSCDIADSTSHDVDGNGIPDECELDCNSNGIPDYFDITQGYSTDCNFNSVPDECDITNGKSEDCNNNNIPDSCEMENGGFIVGATATITFTDPTGSEDVGKTIEIVSHDGTSITYIGNVSSGATDREFNTTISKENSALTLKLCLDHANGHAGKIITVDNGDGTLTLTQVVPGELGNTDITENLSSCTATNFNGGFNITTLDCNANGVPDSCDIADNPNYDEDGDGIPDECELDCNSNGIPDDYEIMMGWSPDVNIDGIPDECQCIADINDDGTVDVNDILAIIGYWNSPIQAGDLNQDGTVGVDDLLIVISNWGPCK